MTREKSEENRTTTKDYRDPDFEASLIRQFGALHPLSKVIISTVTLQQLKAARITVARAKSKTPRRTDGYILDMIASEERCRIEIYLRKNN